MNDEEDFKGCLAGCFFIFVSFLASLVGLVIACKFAKFIWNL